MTEPTEDEHEARRSAHVLTDCHGGFDDGWDGGRDWARRQVATALREHACVLVAFGHGEPGATASTLRLIADDLDPPKPDEPASDSRTVSVTMDGQTYSFHVGEGPTVDSIAEAILQAVSEKRRTKSPVMHEPLCNAINPDAEYNYCSCGAGY